MHPWKAAAPRLTRSTKSEPSGEPDVDCDGLQPLCWETRWMIKTDLPQVLEIEAASFKRPWDEKQLREVLAKRNAIGLVVDIKYPNNKWNVVGHCVYELNPGRLDILTLAVALGWRRQGVGTAIIDKMKAKLMQQRREVVSACVHEAALATQLFFKHCGFRAVEIIPDAYADGEDAYVMRYCIDGKTPDFTSFRT